VSLHSKTHMRHAKTRIGLSNDVPLRCEHAVAGHDRERLINLCRA